MDYQITFPGGVRRAVTFSYDDGTVYDRRLIEIFNKYNLKATFHLNSGKFGLMHSDGEYIKEDEVLSLYSGHEVSAHGYTHQYYSDLTPNQMLSELLLDKRALERLCRYPVRGMSYPFGESFDELVKVAEVIGLEYSRTVNSTFNFNLPTDFMHWNPTCHHNDAMSLLPDFVNAPDWRGLCLFYVWGHSFEFEKENTWDKMEEFCKKTGALDNVWFATNIEIKDYLCAARGIISDADGKTLYNPSAVTVYIKSGGKLLNINPGQMLRL